MLKNDHHKGPLKTLWKWIKRWTEWVSKDNFLYHLVWHCKEPQVLFCKYKTSLKSQILEFKWSFYCHRLSSNYFRMVYGNTQEGGQYFHFKADSKDLKKKQTRINKWIWYTSPRSHVSNQISTCWGRVSSLHMWDLNLSQCCKKIWNKVTKLFYLLN